MAGQGGVWTERVRVRSSEVGPEGRATPAALANWLQEAAGNHVTALGWAVDQLAARGLTWVLSRLHLRIERFPSWREEIEVSTWPSGVQRLHIVRSADGHEIARARTAWQANGETAPDRPTQAG